MASGNITIGIVSTALPKQQRTDKGTVTRPSVHFCNMAEFAHRQGATVCVFTPTDVRWQEDQVVAWTPKDDAAPFRDWIKVRRPLPTVIYENVYVHLAVKGFSGELRRIAATRGIPLYNPPMPGKWAMHRIVTAAAELAKFVPATEVLTTPAHAVAQMDKWGLAYVKPIGGYGGMGVTRIEVLGGGRYRVSVDRAADGSRSGRKLRQEVSRGDLIRRLAARRSVPHLLQQGIQLMTLRNRKVDFRVVLHRGADGSWNLIGIVPKLAAVDGVVTNIIAGGEQMTLADCERMAKLEGKELTIQNLVHVAKRLAERLSARNPMVGLVGFDMGIDHQGGIYMIEMNPKPARSLLTPEMRKTLAEHSVGFALFLANQRSHGKRRVGRAANADVTSLGRTRPGKTVHGRILMVSGWPRSLLH